MDAREQIQKRLENALATLRRELESQGIDVHGLTAIYSVGYEAGEVTVREENFVFVPPVPPVLSFSEAADSAIIDAETDDMPEDATIVADEPKTSKRKSKSGD